MNTCVKLNNFFEIFHFIEGENHKKWLDILTCNDEGYKKSNTIYNQALKNPSTEEQCLTMIQLEQSLVNSTNTISGEQADFSSLQQYTEEDMTRYYEYDALTQYPLSKSHITQHSIMTIIDQTGKLIATKKYEIILLLDLNSFNSSRDLFYNFKLI